MKFYDRKAELQLLEATRKTSEISAKMTMVVGRRRIGKTSLIAEVKRNKNKINIDKLKEQSAELTKKLPGYEIQYTGFSIEDLMV